MLSSAIFPTARMRAGMYESFYLRAVSSEEPVGVWLRHTVHKRPWQRANGSVWFTVFDVRRGRPLMHKLTVDEPRVPPGGWIEVDGARITPEEAQGSCGPAQWSLRFSSCEPELHHFRREWLYRARFPRTKLTSPLPAARFDGTLELEGSTIELRGWRGMVGHNWGSEHAERWIWLHGIGFEQAPEAWLDVALGRMKVAGRMTPWVANGAISLEGHRYRLGGLGARGLNVAEIPEGCAVRIPGGSGLSVQAHADVPAGTAAGWHYADPDEARTPAPSAQLDRPTDPAEERDGHDVINCSVAALTVTVKPAGGGARRELHTAHGGAYELGMRERDHGVPIAPFGDG